MRAAGTRPAALCDRGHGPGLAGGRSVASKVFSVEAGQKPIELILARNLISALSTPAFLVDEGGVLIFYNEAAGTLLGRRFEEIGKVGPEQWGTMFGPVDEGGTPIPYDELPLVLTIREGRPAHAYLKIRSADGAEHDIEVSALPILTPHGSRGGIAFFWPTHEGVTPGS
jgi:PAS domain-containing protein